MKRVTQATKILQWTLTLAGLTIGKWRGGDKTSQWIIFCPCSIFTKSRLKISFLILISLISPSYLFSQNEAVKWYFGDSAGIDFSSGLPISLTDSRMYALESSGTISDTNGNLLFYTDGNTIWNKNHEIMEEGTDLEGSQDASQNGLILNHPDNDSLYYVFLTPYSYDYLNGLKYCVVNIKANNGNGKVIEKNILLHPNSSEKVSAVYHANGRDIWIVGHEWGNNNFFLYLLTNNGLNKCPVINSIGIEYSKQSIFTDGKFTNQGFIKFSSNSKYMAHVFTPPDPLNIFSELYRFDKTNGHLELFTTIPMTVLTWGTEFSDNSENLFIGRRDSPVLVLNIPTMQSKTIDSLILPYAAPLQLSIDGNIYFGLADSTFVGAMKGNDFNNIQVNKKVVNLSRGKMQYGFPNIFTGYLTHGQPRIIYEDKCSNQTFDFGLSSFVVNITKWIFTHPNNEFERTENRPTITFAYTGLWVVRCVLASNDTIVTNVFVEPAIVPHFLGNDTGWCEALGASLTLQAPSGMHCYQWNTGETSPQITVGTAGTYVAKITTPNFCVLYDTIVIILYTLPHTEANFLGDDRHWCENVDTFVTFKAPDGFASYLWNTGDTLSEITADTAGAYWVTATADNGCVTADTLTVSIDTLPDIAPNFLGLDKNWCENLDTSVILEAPADMQQYLWSTGDTLQLIEVKDENIYWAKVAAYNGCVMYDTIIVSLDTVPNIPTLYKDNDTLKTDAIADRYQWLRDGNPTGENKPFLTLSATDTGIYSLRIMSNGGCSAISDTLHVIAEKDTAIDNVNTILLKSIKLYPNPATTELTIEVLEHGSYSYQITGVAGNLLSGGSLRAGANTIDISRMSTGIYFVHVLADSNRITTYKLIKADE